MSWNRRYRLKSYLRSSLWIIPIAAIVLEQVFAAIVFKLDAQLGWAGMSFGLEGARAVCNSVITLTLSFIVFTFGSLLVAIQVASGQYTPRIIATTLLRSAGRRNLRADFLHDRGGNLRVIFRTPDWDDFVHLAFTEIRFCGASNVQIARRLRAMIVNLANTLPAERHHALHQELDLLDRMLEKLYALPEDLALARIPDSQGLGGSTDITAPRWAA